MVKMITRRDFARSAAVMAAATYISPGGVAIDNSQLQPEKTVVTDAMEQALEIFANTGTEFGGGFSNHGPMGAEALVAMGRADAVKGWSEGYKQRLGPHERQGRPVANILRKTPRMTERRCASADETSSESKPATFTRGSMRCNNPALLAVVSAVAEYSIAPSRCEMECSRNAPLRCESFRSLIEISRSKADSSCAVVARAS